MQVETVVIKGIESVSIGLLCPECDGKLYVSFESMKTGQNEPGYCDKCDYRGFRHGGFDIDALPNLSEVQ